jgi:hypothetical protein
LAAEDGFDISAAAQNPQDQRIFAIDEVEDDVFPNRKAA